MNDLSGMDLVPEPRIVIAALNACRRLNDIALAIRFLETVKDKCGGKAEIYPYILQVLLSKKVSFPCVNQLIVTLKFSGNSPNIEPVGS
jgi:hypothetical protein